MESKPDQRSYAFPAALLAAVFNRVWMPRRTAAGRVDHRGSPARSFSASGSQAHLGPGRPRRLDFRTPVAEKAVARVRPKSAARHQFRNRPANQDDQTLISVLELHEAVIKIVERDAEDDNPSSHAAPKGVDQDEHEAGRAEQNTNQAQDREKHVLCLSKPFEAGSKWVPLSDCCFSYSLACWSATSSR